MVLLAEKKIGRRTVFLNWQPFTMLPGTLEIAGFDDDTDGAIPRLPRFVLFSDVIDVAEEISMSQVRFFGILIVFCAGSLVAQEAQKMPMEQLIADLASDDGNKRVA